MDPTLETLITGGGVASVIAALGYILKLVLDFRREPRPKEVHSTPASSDAASANAILSSTLSSLQKENDRLAGRVLHLETELAEVRQENREKDSKILDLETRLNDIARELAALKSSPTA